MRDRSALCAFVTLLLLLGTAACGPEPAPETTPESTEVAAQVPSLSDATDLGVRNAQMPIEGLVTAGQPTEEQLDALVEAGYSRFISLRPATENGAGWEEAHAAGASYGFDRLPIASADDLTRENVEAFAALLDGAGDQPTVLYCGSSNRVGAMLALKAHWLDGATPEEALQLGLESGMTRLEAPVRELLGLAPNG